MTAEQHIERIRAALEEGPTPGEWVAHIAGRFVNPDGPSSCYANVFPAKGGHAICGQKSNRVNGRTKQRVADIRYIAACHPAAIIAILEDHARLKKDAERYRWLRTRRPDALLSVAWGASKAACEIGGDTDAAIDAAMKDPE